MHTVGLLGKVRDNVDSMTKMISMFLVGQEKMCAEGTSKKDKNQWSQIETSK